MPARPPAGLRYCKTCGTYQPIEKFKKNILSAYCAEHLTAYRRNYQKAFVDRHKASDASHRWRRKNPQKAAYYSLKSNAGHRMIEFSLTLEQYVNLISCERCPICEIIFRDTQSVANAGAGRRSGGNRNARSIDRIDTCGTYTFQNCACICLRCNMIKNEGTAVEHQRIADWMTQNRKN